MQFIVFNYIICLGGKNILFKSVIKLGGGSVGKYKARKLGEGFFFLMNKLEEMTEINQICLEMADSI